MMNTLFIGLFVAQNLIVLVKTMKEVGWCKKFIMISFFLMYTFFSSKKKKCLKGF